LASATAAEVLSSSALPWATIGAAWRCGSVFTRLDATAGFGLSTGRTSMPPDGGKMTAAG